MANEFDFDELLSDIQNENPTIEQENEDLSTNLLEPETTENEISEAVMEKNTELMLNHINKSSNTIPEVKDTPLSEAEAFFKDNSTIYKGYIVEYFAYEAKIKELKADWKDTQDGYKDNGISIQSVNKAIRNIKEQLKENEEDSAAVVGVEQMILGNAGFMAELQ